MNGEESFDNPDQPKIDKDQRKETDAYRLLREGEIGKIEKIDDELKGEYVVCLSGEFPVDVLLTIAEVNKERARALVHPVELERENDKKWVDIKNLRLHDAVEEYIGDVIEADNAQ